MKDTTFNFSRLIHLFHKDVAENWRKYILYVGTMFGVFVIFFLWRGFFVYKVTPTDVPDRMVSACVNMFIAMWFIYGCVSASFTMENLKRKSNRISVFTLPATPLEKYFSRWFIHTVIFLLLFVFSFKLADYIRVLVFSLSFPSISVHPVSLNSIFTISGLDCHLYNNISSVSGLVIGYFFLQSCFVLGSVWWPKNAFPKTFLALFCILILFSVALWGIVRIFLFKETLQGVHIENGSDILGRNIYWALGIGFTLFNWIIGYYRFKETDIL
ncbi:MAG: hypothetical protein LUF85_00285 [Bacteroides sp.]|nr:hypothetical protein [Bacteroides sp.]